MTTSAMTLGILISLSAPVGQKETRTFDASGLDSLQVANGAGDVRVRAGDGSVATVNINKVRFDRGCKLTTEAKGRQLVIELRTEPSMFGPSCKVDFDIVVPKKFDMSFKVGSGGVEVDGTTGRIKVKIGSGHTEIAANVSELEVKTGSGRVDVDGLMGPATVKAGSGEIRLGYARVPKGTRLDIRTGSADAQVRLPTGTTVRANLRAGSGTVRNRFADSDNPDLEVSMRAGSGDLVIEPRDSKLKR